MNKIRRLLLYVPMLALASCIQNDIPYPVVAIDILEVKGEGFTCTASDIDAKLRTVTLHLDEATDISRVRSPRSSSPKAAAHRSPFPANSTCAATCPSRCRSIRTTNGR